MDMGGRVLVVEDDDSMRQAVERLLNAAGYANAVYSSAEELLASAPVKGDVCVISDLKLPGMSGLELLAELRKRGCQQPMILMTAHDSPSGRKEAEHCGVAVYLMKPFLGSELVAVLRRVLAAPSAA